MLVMFYRVNTEASIVRNNIVYFLCIDSRKVLTLDLHNDKNTVIKDQTNEGRLSW